MQIRGVAKGSVRLSRLTCHSGVAALTTLSLVAILGSNVGAAATIAHTLAVSTDELRFGQTTLGTTGGPLVLSLTNTGESTDSIDLAAATSSGPGTDDYFMLASPDQDCPGGSGPRIVLASGQSCAVDVYFVPTALGQLPATVTIQGSADASGVSVSFSGQGSIGYYQVDSRGEVATAGDAAYFGDTRALNLNQPIVGITPTGDNKGYWLVGSDGGVYSYGDAKFWGSAGNLTLNKPIVGMATTGAEDGYWLVASDGGVFSYGDAQFWGSAEGLHLNQPIVGIASLGYGGYWLFSSDGGVFAYGDATFYGSGGGLHLNAPIVGMAPTPDGGGYWLVAADGGVFAYGDAGFYGSLGAIHLAEPVVGMAAMPTGGGYWIGAADGGLFAYGDAPFYGSAVDSGIGEVVGMASDGGPSAVLP